MENRKYLGKMIISWKLNEKTGDVMFHIGTEHDSKVVENKCLFDALSQYGVAYDSAKYITEKCAKFFNSDAHFRLYSTDIYKASPIKHRAAKRDE